MESAPNAVANLLSVKGSTGDSWGALIILNVNLRKNYKQLYNSCLDYIPSTLVIHLYFLQVVLSLLFRRSKSYKSARHWQNIAFGESWLRSLIKAQASLAFYSLAQEFTTAFCSRVASDIPRLTVVCHQILSFCFWVVRNSFS